MLTKSDFYLFLRASFILGLRGVCDQGHARA
jgi:hypothetical protein